MCKKLLRGAVAVVISFAMVLESAATFTYAAGNETGSYSNSGTDIEKIINDRTYDPDRSLQQESAGIFLDKETAEVINNASDAEILEANDDTVLFENTDKRDVNVKSYKLTDSSNVMLLYPVTVHEKDVNGVWVEIDNLIKESETKDGERIFTAENLSAKVVLFASPKGGRFLELQTGSGKITWGLDAEDVRAEGSSKDPEVKKGYEKLQIKSISGILTYKDVLSGVDLNYQLLGHNVEEAVVVNTREAAESIAAEGLNYVLALEGYRAELKENAVCLYPEGSDEPEYVISAPYMEDAATEEDGDITLSLKEKSEGYIVTIYPDSEWLLSEDRVYPVIIDPTIVQYADVTHLDTCSVYSNSPNSNLYNYGNLLLGRAFCKVG